MKRFFIFFVMLFGGLTASLQAQMLTGNVSSAEGPVVGASVTAKPGSAGAVSDINGNFSFKVVPGTYTISVSYLGYETQSTTMTFAANETKTLNVSLLDNAQSLSDVVVVGSRTAARSSTTSPLPVDVLAAKELVATGQNTFDKALQFRVPSFNTVQTPVNDATALLDPYEIRNMGPSRTLILINGKRKNTSALLYTQTSPGRGESGADISAIPTDAIKRVEILRDGASAQYGSDAIAGVMNIILKDDVENGGVTLRTGVTSEGDGAMFGVALNNGTTLGKKGFLNYTIDLSKVDLANRPGTVDAAGEAADFGADLATVQSFLARFPDAGNINGAPKTTAAKFAINGGSQISENVEMYANAAYVYKKVNSFANYRTPYWRTLADFPYLDDFFGVGANKEYVGYVPTFDGNLNDYNGTVGFRSTKNGWVADLSYTVGGNEQTYVVTNSHNRNGTTNPDGTNKYKENSPISFDPGGTRFTHQVGNIDISRRLNDKVAIAFGSEFRSETFTVIAGELASYEDGGADSFAGNSEENSGANNRYNIGGYADASFDITEDFLLNTTARYENYSDFGDAVVGKISTRYKMMDDKLTLRGSYSTGFRAPLLHQIYTQKAQYSFEPGQGIQVGGLVSNVSREARLIGIPKLTPEKSTNITVGVGAKLNRNMSITLDYYNIAVEDRIVLSTEINPTDAGNTALDQVLNENNLKDISFFVNAMDTRTSGIDFVANYRNLGLGSGKLGINLAGNYQLSNEREGDVKDPSLIKGAGQTVVNATQEALFFTSRPEYKAILGFDYEMGKWIFSLNNTLFGPTTFRQSGMNTNLQTQFLPKILTDLGINFQATKNLTISANINNILNVVPEWEFQALNAAGEAVLKDAAAVKANSNAITFNQRYSGVTYDGSHFSQLGTIANLALRIGF